jgi:hypothetical protein
VAFSLCDASSDDSQFSELLESEFLDHSSHFSELLFFFSQVFSLFDSDLPSCDSQFCEDSLLLFSLFELLFLSDLSQD